ncbi:MAG: rod shape-determining protein MreD [Thermodesulfobacteriota bacterium]|nr:rod shape-determining protein MreD [Thermodesulfobacteriota bacterium]
MKLLFFSAISLFLLIIQTSFLKVFLGSSLNLDLTLIMVVYFGLFLNYHSGIFLSFIAGYLADILSGTILGAIILIRLLDFVVIYKLKKIVYPKNIISQSFLVLLLSFIENSAFSIYFFGLGETLFTYLSAKIMPQALLNSLFAPLVISIINKAEKSFFHIKEI